MFRTTARVSILFIAFLGFLVGPIAAGKAAAATQVSVTIHPRRERNTISRGIYSQFLEHIYHSADNGLWGEMIWNRSFEEPLHSAGGQWVRKGTEIRQLSLAANIRKSFGSPDWKNYQLSLDAKKLGGAEGFMIYFYNHDRRRWFVLNLGGWGNTRDVLQRGGANPRPGILVSKPTIHIHRGRWYHLRLRCDGPRIEVWVDGKSYFDRTVESGILTGGISLGTWRTRAAYKNIVVTSITSGKVLYKGVPSAENAMPHLATRFWNSFGSGTALPTTTDPRNSRICIRISSTKGETGVRQPNICLPSAGIYRGSLWVRDAARHRMTVSLRDGKTRLGRKISIVDSAKWQRIGFSFSTASPVHHATLQIGFTGKGNVYLDQVSMMSDAARKLGGFRPDTLEAVEALKPAMIRWPGGSYSDKYHWMNGIGPQVDRVSAGEMWDDMDPNALGTDECIHLCRLTHAKSEICINIGPRHASAAVRSKYIQEACHWLEYCNAPASNTWGALRAKYGHPKPYNVRYWEIGNEVWSIANAPQYARIVRQFVPAMKKLDPSIRIIACGSGGLNQKWNRQLLAGASGSFDYLSLHQYVPPQRFLTAAKQYLAFTRKTGQLIKASANPHCKIFVSEWNAQSIDWRTGLFAGGILVGFERQGAMVRLSTPALFLRWVGTGAWNNAFINFSRCAWFPAPNYVVEKLWRDHYAKYRVAATSAEPLEADATLSADRKTAYYKAVNPTRRTIQLKLNMGSGFQLASAAAQSVTSASLLTRNTMRNPHRIAAHNLAVTVSGQQVSLTVARYSATIVTMRRAGK